MHGTRLSQEKSVGKICIPHLVCSLNSWNPSSWSPRFSWSLVERLLARFNITWEVLLCWELIYHLEAKTFLDSLAKKAEPFTFFSLLQNHLAPIFFAALATALRRERFFCFVGSYLFLQALFVAVPFRIIYGPSSRAFELEPIVLLGPYVPTEGGQEKWNRQHTFALDSLPCWFQISCQDKRYILFNMPRKKVFAKRTSFRFPLIWPCWPGSC